ncbi:MAG: TDP-N-acetylfucosamine:lipid II N-acetylfucosaminyltransferase [Chitinophagaceae bacterium]|nr:TDP-N-acetylfucosamine:lipid II N-acetylfucosaminyltransferase [Chitinophagaceae bacterium]
MIYEKFIKGYIQFVEEHFDISDHTFYIIGKEQTAYNLNGLPNVVKISSYSSLFRLLGGLLFSKKIILHGLWHPGINRLLLMQPWLIEKCYWMMWGGDFYYYDLEPAYKKKLIRKIRHFVGFVKGDYEFIKNKYGAEGMFHESILYPVAFCDGYAVKNNKTENIVRILVGNSADPSNNHLAIFNKLSEYKNESIEIIVPLSYGNKEYANEVINAGRMIFGDKLRPLNDFMPLHEYETLLNSIDIGIFNHGRQQGLGNIIKLLSYGKKVYLRNDISTWDFFTDMGVTLCNIEVVDLTPIDPEVAETNAKLVGSYFTKENYIKQLASLFKQ